MSVVQLLDLPDELLLNILKKVDPQALLLCSMIDIDNHRLEQLAFDGCHSIDLSFDFYRARHRSPMKRFFSHVMPRICHNIQSLTISLRHIRCLKTSIINRTFPNLTHFKILLGLKCYQTGIPYTIGFDAISVLSKRKPLCAIVLESFVLPKSFLGDEIGALCRSSLMHSVRSFELDDNCFLTEILDQDQLRFGLAIRLIHVRISVMDFAQCIDLLNEIGSQLHSFIVIIRWVLDDQLGVTLRTSSISCPHLKQLKLTIYRNFDNYKPCISLLQRLSSVEHLTLLLAVGKENKSNRFIDECVLERDILPYMPHLRQFHFHIRSIAKNASYITINRIRRSFRTLQQKPFDCVLDHFKNQYGQYQIYSLPFIGTRLDFISNRFPLFDNNNNTFSTVTTLLLFDDIQPFENIFFEQLARSLPRLKTLEIFNQLEQQEKTTAMKTNAVFDHLAALILYDGPMDYAEQFLYRMNLSSLTELVIDTDILLKIIAENNEQARKNCSRVGTLQTSKPLYQSIDAIRNFFPLAFYVRHRDE